VTGDRGQALVLAAVMLGVAAVAVVGLRSASDRILAQARTQRAGEAAVAAAGAAVADLARARVARLGHELSRREVAALVAEPAVIEAARSAAVTLARAHGEADPSGVQILAFDLEIEVHVTLGGRTHVALLASEP